ncbi:unnamed protein product [Rhizophagus irregularis]|nr:unnamed protein product [Rhizophagus irregularis]
MKIWDKDNVLHQNGVHFWNNLTEEYGRKFRNKNIYENLNLSLKELETLGMDQLIDANVLKPYNAWFLCRFTIIRESKTYF